jgi:hypothetical protein
MLSFSFAFALNRSASRYIKKIYPSHDPRNAPHNPHLNIPRSIMSQDDRTSSANSSLDALEGHSSLRTPLQSGHSVYDIENPIWDNETCLVMPTSTASGDRYFVDHGADSPQVSASFRKRLSTAGSEQVDICDM